MRRRARSSRAPRSRSRVGVSALRASQGCALALPLDGAELKITTGKWYTPSGRSIHRERSCSPTDALSKRSLTLSRRKREEEAAVQVGCGAHRLRRWNHADVIVPDDTLTTVEQDLQVDGDQGTGLHHAQPRLRVKGCRTFTVTPALAEFAVASRPQVSRSIPVRTRPPRSLDRLDSLRSCWAACKGSQSQKTISSQVVEP